MRYLDSPLFYGSTEEKIEQITQYLQRQVNDLNHNIENTTAEKIWEKTAQALLSSENTENEEQLKRDEYGTLRRLIMKSAVAVLKVEDSFANVLEGAYLAESDYGVFWEEGTLSVNGTPYNISQLYQYQSAVLSGVNEYKTNLEGYIVTGVLDRDTSSPVFGIDIGYNKSTFKVGDTEYTNNNPSKIRITPDRIGFWQSDTEVAYIESKAIYFPNAHITGGSIKIGSSFSVDNSGYMTASNATISGNITASSGKIAGFYVAGAGNSGNGFWNWSFSSVINTTAGIITEEAPQYVVFMRGQSDDGTAGAKSPDNCVFGVKKRTSSSTSWNNAEYTFYVKASGELESGLSGTKVKIKEGYIKFYTTVSSSLKEYGTIIAAIDGNIDSENPMLCIQSHSTNSAGMILSASSSSWYAMFKSAQENGSVDYRHAFYGNVLLKNNVDVGGDIYLGGNIALCITDAGVLSIGSSSQTFDTIIKSSSSYKVTLQAGYIYLNGTVRIPKDIGITFGAGSTYYQGIIYGTAGSLSGFHLGISSKNTYIWGTVLLSSGTAVTSDRRKKKGIENLNSKHEKMFMELLPRTFEYTNGASNRRHFGFVAQEVEEAITSSGLTTKDVAAFVSFEHDNEDRDSEYALRYEEFIALNTYMIKKCLKKISDLEAQIKILEKES